MMTVGEMMNPLLFIGTTELLLIGGMALLLFGGKKLPEMMRGLGQGVKEFKKGMNEVKAPLEEEDPEAATGAEKEPETDGDASGKEKGGSEHEGRS